MAWSSTVVVVASVVVGASDVVGAGVVAGSVVTVAGDDVLGDSLFDVSDPEHATASSINPTSAHAPQRPIAAS